MTLRTFVAATAAVVAGLVSGCSHPTGPTGNSSPPTPPTPLLLKIAAPATIAPGQTVSVVATASMSDGTTQDYTRKVAWSASPPSVLTMAGDTGQATAHAVGDAMIVASLHGSCCHAQITITVLPPNTYRLTGKVLESGLPVQGGTVAVLSGTGAGLSATTNFDGSYRLYGVADSIQIKFSKPGYDDLVKTFTANRNDVLDFLEAHQTAGIPSLAGTYTLTLTADAGCPTIPLGGIGALPDEFRQPRSYAASLTQDGPSLTLTLTGATILPQGNRFTGRVEPGSIEFNVGYGYYGYGVSDGIAEQVSSTQTFVFGGQVQGQRSGTAIIGHLNGVLEVYTATSASNYGLTALCIASNNPVTLTPVAQPARRR